MLIPVEALAPWLAFINACTALGLVEAKLLQITGRPRPRAG